jgi:hypothetical protein
MITVQHAMVQRSMCCSMCQNVFKDPRILACGHTFCLTCLAKQTRSMKIPQCGVCQKSWPSPATSLLKNEAVASVCNILSAALSQNPILDCSLPSFNVIEQESSKSCSQHVDQKMICYCKSCAELLCPRCAIKSHKGHDCVEIADYCKELDQILLKKQNEHKTTEKSLEDQIGKLQAKRAEEASIVLSYDLLLSGYAKLADKVHAAKDTQSFSESCRQTRSLLPIARGHELPGSHYPATAHSERNAALFPGNFVAGMSDCSLEPERDNPTSTTASSRYSTVTFELCNDTSDVDETRTMSVYAVTEADQQDDEIYYKLEVTSSTGTLDSTAPSERLQQQLLKSGTIPAKSVQLIKFGDYRNAATTTRPRESRSANGTAKVAQNARHYSVCFLIISQTRQKMHRNEIRFAARASTEDIVYASAGTCKRVRR